MSTKTMVYHNMSTIIDWLVQKKVLYRRADLKQELKFNRYERYEQQKQASPN